MSKILEYAKEMFDVVGISGTYLILGLESRIGRTLDNYFAKSGGRFGFPGMAEHFSAPVEAVIKELQKSGFEARQIRDNSVNFKQLAVRAGIGVWGKNSLVIHPVFGPWVRFVVLETNFKFTDGHPSKNKPKFDKCRVCNKCVKACPVRALRPFKIPDKEICTAYDQLDFPTMGVALRCDFCLQACMPQRQ